MNITQQIEGDRLQIAFKGRSTFGDYKLIEQLCQKIEQVSARTRTVELSLVGLDYIDSAGLGMLLLLREQCEKYLMQLTIQCADGQVWKMLEVSRLAELFGITNVSCAASIAAK